MFQDAQALVVLYFNCFMHNLLRAIYEKFYFLAPHLLGGSSRLVHLVAPPVMVGKEISHKGDETENGANEGCHDVGDFMQTEEVCGQNYLCPVPCGA